MESNEQQVADRLTALKKAFPTTIPVLTGYICLGMAFGILLQTSGHVADQRI